MDWLPWRYAVVLGVIFCVVVLVARKRPERSWQLVRSFCAEAAIISFLYSLWALAGRLSVARVDGAIENGEWIWDLERQLRLPSELAWQQAMIPHSLWTQASNLYYFYAHVPVTGIFLVWLFFRHRSSFPTWRNTLAGLTGACFTIQLIPVAPPRLVDSLGVIDTGLAYDQSIYGTLGYTIAGQLQAMPSVHVAWAALVAWAAWTESDSAWRWVAVFHGVATFYVVGVTGNHYWLDGIVSILLMVMIYPFATRLAAAMRSMRGVSAKVELDAAKVAPAGAGVGLDGAIQRTQTAASLSKESQAKESVPAAAE